MDETGWRLLCASAWAWVFTNSTHTLYVIVASRGHEVVLKILGPEFEGFLESDCFAAYNALPYPAERKPKCASHFLTGLKEAGHFASGRDGDFVRAAKDLLKLAIEVKRHKIDLSEADYQRLRAGINTSMDKLLELNVTEPLSRRMANRMRKHRPGLLAFLDHDIVPPTNNIAERQIRPIVIHRKLSGGNRSELGARALTGLASVFATTCQQGVRFADVVIRALRLRGTGQSALPP